MKKAKLMYLISTIIYMFLLSTMSIVQTIFYIQDEYVNAVEAVYYQFILILWLAPLIAIIVCSSIKNKKAVFSSAILAVIFGVLGFFSSIISFFQEDTIVVLVGVLDFFSNCLMIAGGIWYITLFASENSKVVNMESNNEKMTLAYRLMIVNVVFAGLLLIPLAWSIPMTLAVKKLQFEYKDSTSLGICSILFLGIFGFIAGILILGNRKENYKTSGNEINVIKHVNVFANTENK